MIFKLIVDKDRSEEVVAYVHSRSALTDEIERLVQSDAAGDKLYGYKEGEITVLQISDIECFAVQNEKTYAIYKDKESYLIKKRLYELEESLPPAFERISKSAIANRNKIKKYKVQLSGAVDAVFESGYSECISRRCFRELKRRHNL